MYADPRIALIDGGNVVKLTLTKATEVKLTKTWSPGYTAMLFGINAKMDAEDTPSARDMLQVLQGIEVVPVTLEMT